MCCDFHCPNRFVKSICLTKFKSCHLFCCYEFTFWTWMEMEKHGFDGQVHTSDLRCIQLVVTYGGCFHSVMVLSSVRPHNAIALDNRNAIPITASHYGSSSPLQYQARSKHLSQQDCAPHVLITHPKIGYGNLLLIWQWIQCKCYH